MRTVLLLGIVTGNPRVFQGYPDPDPVRTRTWPLGMGFAGYGYRYPSGHTDMRRVGSMGWVGMYQAGEAGIRCLEYQKFVIMPRMTNINAMAPSKQGQSSMGEGNMFDKEEAD